MARIEVRLLGGFAVARGGTPLELPGRKPQALLARLARRPGEEVARASLAALLWPDRGEEQARGSLRQALGALRRALGAGVLRAEAGVVALDAGAVDADVARFEAAGADPGAFAGPFLSGFPPVAEPFDDWVHAERAALTARALDAFRARLDALAAEGDPAGLALAERALAVDPAFEPAYRARMALLAAGGDPAAALREHGRCREALSRALGVEPGPETEALRRSIAAARAEASAPPQARGLPAVAVLPPEVLSGGRDAGPFARGLAEDVQLELARFRTLRVLAPAGGPGAAEPPPGADYLLLASVREAGGRVRVSARLVEAAGGRQVWGDRLDADLADALGVQERLAREVAAALALRIDEAALAAARRRPAASLDAYALWLSGMEALRRGSREADLEARARFARALELDPGFARAHTGLSLSHFNDWSCAAWDRWEENEAAAHRHAREATRLDPHDPVGHCILARVLLYRREWDEGEAHLRRALALNPNDADVLAHLALGFAYLGSPEEGLAAGEAARRLNPAHPDWYLQCLAANHLFARRPREVTALLARAPDAFVDTRAFLAAAAAHLGDLDAARAHARRFLARFGGSIAPGAAPDAAIGWVLQVNPLRRDEDRAWLVEGLRRAGLAGRAGERAGVDRHA